MVNHVQRLVKPLKVGHAGTLDPLATGVLVICVGPCTRLIRFVQQQPKTYRATFELGLQSDTEDITGRVEPYPDAVSVTREEIERVLPEFEGRISQIPPRFSAVHVRGKRAYKLAREGREFELEPREVHVHRLTLLDFQPPHLQLEIQCGSGTFVRSLGRDVGRRLACGAVMSQLERTAVGVFELGKSVALEQLTSESLPEQLASPLLAVAELTRVVCLDSHLTPLSHGRPLKSGGILATPGEGWQPDRLYAVITRQGELCSVARWDAESAALRHQHVFIGRNR